MPCSMLCTGYCEDAYAMTSVTIWHNPRCSKSRQTLALLQDRGVEIVERRYLEAPPTRDEITAALSALGISAGELLRRGEAQFKSLELGKDAPDAALLDAMAEHPVLIERPIVFKGSRAVLGRPPENVLALFD